MKVLYLGLMTGNNGFTKAFRGNCLGYTEVNCGDIDFNAKAQSIAVKMRPDLIFIQIQTPNVITEETAKLLKSTRAFVINWTGDVRSPIPKWYYDIGKHIDLTCFSNMTDVIKFRESGLNSEYLEIGFDPEIYKPGGESHKMPEIVFMGNNYGSLFPLSKYRFEMVDFLKNTYGSRFGFYGNGWGDCNGNFNSSQYEEAKAYRGSKIAINLSHFDYERYNSDRILRIMGTGTPICLTKGYKGIEKDYEPGINLDVWNNFNELKDKIDYYLTNDEDRIKIAHNGYELVNKKFTFDSMIKNILKLKT